MIGRGGEKIAQIQKDSNVKMKMSKANDYYPNTNERICLIIGSIKSVLKAHDYIVERLLEKPESSNKQQTPESEERANQVILNILIILKKKKMNVDIQNYFKNNIL